MKVLSAVTDFLADGVDAIELLPHRCLRRRLNTCECRKCVDVCKSAALSLSGRQLQHRAEQCTGCMHCHAVCPNEALCAGLDLEQFLHNVRQKKKPVISCVRQKPVAVDELTLPCLGLLADEKIVLALGKSSGCSRILFNVTGCGDCVNTDAAGAFLAALREVVGRVPQVLTSELCLFDADREEAAEETGTRRAFLSGLCLDVRSFMRHLPTAGGRPQPTPAETGRRVPVRTRIFEKVVASVGEEVRGQLLALYGNRLAVNSRCRYCPRCAGICPTAALRLVDGQLLFTPARCTGCGLCAAFCPHGALELLHHPSLRPKQTAGRSVSSAGT